MFQVLRIPGHTPDLIVLWNAGEGILLANDLVFAPISPNISAGPMAGPDPLGDYLASPDRAARLPARLTLTGHRAPSPDLAARCAAVQDPHRRRLAHTLELLDGTRTAWGVGQSLFAGIIDSLATMMFTLGETVAHLEYLRARDRVRRRQDDDGLLRYERV